MLAELNIRNFAIIDELKVSFDKGLNMISGETGAGKSIIVGAVGLLLGDRAKAEMIRSFEDSAVVEALFDIGEHEALREMVREMGFGDGDELIIRRVVSRSGKNRIYINGGLAPLQSLAAIGESLINVCGQHEHQMILNPDNHSDILDEFGGLLPLRAIYRERYEAHRALLEKMRALGKLSAVRTEREALLRYQIDEISKAGLHPGEDDGLAEERRLLMNVQKRIDLAENAYEILYGRGDSVLSQLRGAVSAVKEIKEIDSGLKLSEEELEELYYGIEEAAFALRDYAKGLAPDPGRLETVEERLEFLGHLKRKYRGTIEEILNRGADAERELAELGSLAEETAAVNRQIAVGQEKMVATAAELSTRRRETAVALERAVEKEMGSLGMERARFEVVFEDPPGSDGNPSLNEKGMDTLEFYLAANAGEEMKPLRAVASGGELSRIMLVLKKVLARTGSVGTIVFDEVDSGIGGATAEIVGRKLQEVARHHQVLCITHLPQIACCGGSHYRVVKRAVADRTTTSMSRLTGEERVEEIARMLGGVSLTQTAKDHAAEMLGNAGRRGRPRDDEKGAGRRG